MVNKIRNSVENRFMYSDKEESEEEFFTCDLKSNFWSWQPKADNFFLQFCRDSTVHGLKYIGEEGQHLLTRIFWTIAVLAAFGMSIYLIYKGVVEPMRANPVIISFQDKEITVNEIPFPAFTLCNANKLKMSAVYNLSRVLLPYKDLSENNLTSNIINSSDLASKILALQYLANYCTISQSFSEYFDLAHLFDTSLDVNPELKEKVGFQNIWNHAQQGFHKCDETILLCSWKNQEVPCKRLFHPIQTEFGYCCVFNMMPQSVLRKTTQNLSYWERNLIPKDLSDWKGWDIDSNLVNEGKKSGNYPRHQRKAGMNSGLSILINPELDDYWSECRAQDSVGFRAQAHNPIENPHIVDFGTTIRANSETFIAVQAEITTADPDVARIHKSKRQCYFLGDYTLTEFNFYSQTNCLDECMAEITFLACHCVPYYMPRQDQPLCNNVTEYGCLRDLRKNLTSTGIKAVCEHCLPSCTQIRYTSDTSNLPLRDDVGIWKNMSTDLYEKWADKKPAIVHVYFSKNTVNSKVRKNLYGIMDIVANAGGLLGLTLGFSVISLVEFLYFIFLRLWNNRSSSQGIHKINSKLKSVGNKIRPKKVFSPTFLVNPADFMRWSDAYATKEKMHPRLRIKHISVKNHA